MQNWLTVLLCAVVAYADPSKELDKENKGKGPNDPIDLIVQWKPGEGVTGRLRMLNKGQLKRELLSINASVYTVKVNQAKHFVNDPAVRVVSTDLGVRGQQTLADPGPDFGWATAMRLSNATTTNFAQRGFGVGVAVLDSGFARGPHLSSVLGLSTVVHEESFVAGEDAQSDLYGHGTHVVGVLASNADESTGSAYDYRVRGIAPWVNIVNLKVLNRNGQGSEADVIEAIDRAIQLKSRYNIRVLTMSLGRPALRSHTEDPICAAVRRAWEAGIVVVISAGNHGRNNVANNRGHGTITSPGISPYAITVGAMSTKRTLTASDDQLTSFSSKGPTAIDKIVKPDLVAPGNRILSLRRVGSYLDSQYPSNRVPESTYKPIIDNDVSPYYMVMSGSSMAAPMVAGAAALLIEKDSTLTPDQVKARLMKTATKLPRGAYSVKDNTTGLTYTLQNDVFSVGAGYLNIEAALANTEKITGRALSPKAYWDKAAHQMKISTASPVQGVAMGWNQAGFGWNGVWGGLALWGDVALWGDLALWGDVALWGDLALWGDVALWGDAALGSQLALWGEGAPGGQLALWGDNSSWGDVNASSALVNGDRDN